MVTKKGILVLIALLLLPSVAWSANNNPLLVGGPNDLPKRRVPVPESAASGAHLTYYGGRVVSNMQVIQVLWGTGGIGKGDGEFLAGVFNTTAPSMATFYQQVLNSGYVDWLTEYNTDITDFAGNPGTNQIIGRGSFAEQVAITPVNTSTTLSDMDIQTELVNQIMAGHVPMPTADGAGNNNTYYAIFFPHGIVINMGGSDSCAPGGFCAYHGTIVADAPVGEIYYGVHPDFQAGSGCDTGCGMGTTTFNNVTSVSSHEMAETITDCETSLAMSLGPPLAWYDVDPNAGEIGDICNEQQGSIVGGDGHTYTVQKLFSNNAGACIVEPGGSVLISPSSKNFGSVKVRQQKTVTFTLTNPAKSGPPIVFGTPPATVPVTSPQEFGFLGRTKTNCSQLPPKKKCTISLTFAPQSKGAKAAVMSVFDSASVAPQMVPVSGTGH